MDAESKYLEADKIDSLTSFIDKDKLVLLMSTYLEDSQKILSRLKAVIAESNIEEATRLVHSLKSTSANVGAIRLSELAKSMEQLARAGELDTIEAQLNELTELFGHTRNSIEQLDFMKN